MSTSSTQTPLKIIGKEFLYDENLFITNYNPFETSNTSGIQGLFSTKTFIGKLYIFDKTNYTEPTRDQFRTIKTYSDMAQFKKVTGITTVNYFTIGFTVSYDQTTKLRSLVLDTGNTNSTIIPNIGSQDISIFNNSFGIFIIDKDINNPNDKVYTDLTSSDSSFMWLIPSEYISISGTSTSKEGINIVLSNPSKRNITKTSAFYCGPYEELVPGYTQDAGRLQIQNTMLDATNLPDNLTWVAQTNLPEYAGWARFTSYGNFAYWLGGYNLVGQSAVGTTKIWKAPINSDGSIGTYVNIGTLPNSITNINPPTIIKDKIWIIGGNQSGITVLNTYYAQINSDGSFGTWNSGPTLPDYVSSIPVIVNNRIYFFGGYSSQTTSYKDHIICGDIGPDGIVTRFYKLGTTLGFTYEGHVVFAYGNKIFMSPGYNRTASAYLSTIYSFVVNPDGTLQPAVSTNSPITACYSKIIQIGKKVYNIGGGSTSGYLSTIQAADITIDSTGNVNLSTWRTLTNFPVAMHGSDGVVITKNYIYLYPQREGTTWVNSNKVYRADISSYNIGAKNDYSKDSYHYKQVITIPSSVDAKPTDTSLSISATKQSVLNNSFIDGSFTISIPQFKKNSDGTLGSIITDNEILTFIQNQKVNKQLFSITGITLDDLIIQRPSDTSTTTGANLKIQIQIILSEEKLQKLNYKSEYNKPDIFGDGSCVSWYQFNGNMYDQVRNIHVDGSDVNAYTKGLYTFGNNDDSVSNTNVTRARRSYLASSSTATNIGCGLGNPHGSSTTVTISAWIYWNGAASQMPFAVGPQTCWFNGTYFGFNSGNGDVYGMSSTTNMSGLWRHLIMQFNTSANGKMWLDGVPQTLSQLSGTVNNANRTVANNTVVLFPQNYANFGLIDNLRIFNRAITDAEAMMLYREVSEDLHISLTKPFTKDPAFPALTDKYLPTTTNIDKINYINGRPWEQQYYIDRPDPDNLTFALDTSLPFVFGWGGVIQAKGRVYLLGGSRSGANNASTAVSTINVAPINSDGTLGTFVASTSTLPTTLYAHKTILIKDRIFIFGGTTNGTTFLSNVYSCLVNDDGTLGTWRTETSLPFVTVGTNFVVTKNRIYMIGGYGGFSSTDIRNTIYSCPINDDLTLGAWTNTGITYPITMYVGSTVLIKNKIYIIGGLTVNTSTYSNQIYSATINDDGTLTPFTLFGTFPTTIGSLNVLTTKNRIYALGGIKDVTTGVATNQNYSAPIDANGNIGTWVAGPTLPSAFHCSENLIVTSSYVYILGGREYVSSGVWKDTTKVMRAPLNGGKNDYTGDNISTSTYQTTTYKTNFIEQKQLSVNINSKFDTNTAGVSLDNIVIDFEVKPNQNVIDFDGGTAMYEVQQLATNQTSGAFVNTGKKVYLYGGRSDNSAALTQTLSNTLWVSNILNDGSLEGFTNVGTNSINLYSIVNYTYTNPLGQTFCYLFGGLTPGLTTNMNSTSSIRRTLVNGDGTISNWTIIDNLPYSCYNSTLIPNPEDPSYFWYFIGDNQSAGTYTSYRNKVCYYKINIDGSLTLIRTQTLNENYVFNAFYVTRDPKDGHQYLFMFGTEAINSSANYIRKYKIADNGQIISSAAIIIGTIDKAKHGTYCIEDTNNIYIVGGYANYTGYTIGADNRVLKYSKVDLLNATPTNPISPTMEPTLSIPISGNQYNFVKTPYATYIICPSTTTQTDGTSLNYQTTNKIIGFKNNLTNLGSNSFNLNDAKFNITPEDLKASNQHAKLIPNKLNSRVREELLSNLVIKSSQTLNALGETIKFKDTTSNGNNTIITLAEATKAVAIGKREAKFLEWVVALSKDQKLDLYNNYLYTTKYDINSSRNYDIIIPEIIFNILCDRNMYNISLDVFTSYLTSNAPITYNIDTSTLEDFDIAKILTCFYRFQSTTLNTTAVTYTASGIQLPVYNTFGFNKQINDVSYIFIPQRHSKKELLPSSLPPRPKLSSYFDSIGSCIYKKKIEESLINYKTYERDMISSIPYFVGPNGSDSNDGLTIYTAKATIGSCPAGSNVFLLPGTYTGWTYLKTLSGGTQIYNPSVLHGFNGHNIYGFGNSTIIDARSSKWFYSLIYNSAGSIHNIKILFGGGGGLSSGFGSYAAIVYFEGSYIGNLNFYNCNIQYTGSYHPGSSNNTTYGNYVKYYNCSISGGTYINSSYGDYSSYATITNSQIDKDLLAGTFTPNMISNKSYIDNLHTTIEFTPTYTLLPISDDSVSDSNSIILENASNFTSIPNLSYKL